MTSQRASDVQEQLEQFIRRRFDVRPDDPYFSREVNLWEEGYVDSIGALEVISFIEGSLQIEVSEPMLFDPRFTSIAGMAELLTSRAG